MCARADLLRYVDELSEETRECLLIFYVDWNLGLLSAETVGRGGIDEVGVDRAAIICRGRALGASGFFMVHNHPGGDARQGQADIAMIQNFRRLSVVSDMPLIDHSIVAACESRLALPVSIAQARQSSVSPMGFHDEAQKP